MYFLNTSRRLLTPATDATLDLLRGRIDGIADKAGTLGGMRSIAWLVSLDRTRMQAFSQFDTAGELETAEHSPQHVENSALIADLLGGLTEPQTHTYYELLSQRRFG
jgi:hypothetical protein